MPTAKAGLYRCHHHPRREAHAVSQLWPNLHICRDCNRKEQERITGVRLSSTTIRETIRDLKVLRQDHLDKAHSDAAHAALATLSFDGKCLELRTLDNAIKGLS